MTHRRSVTWLTQRPRYPAWTALCRALMAADPLSTWLLDVLDFTWRMQPDYDLRPFASVVYKTMTARYYRGLR